MSERLADLLQSLNDTIEGMIIAEQNELWKKARMARMRAAKEAVLVAATLLLENMNEDGEE